jgi:hypothetical protein
VRCKSLKLVSGSDEREARGACNLGSHCLSEAREGVQACPDGGAALRESEQTGQGALHPADAVCHLQETKVATLLLLDKGTVLFLIEIVAWHVEDSKDYLLSIPTEFLA